MVEGGYETIRYEIADGIATITLNRPQVLNALNATMRRELLAALNAARKDDAVRAVLISGEGRAFCAGADLRGGDEERQFRRVLSTEYNPLIRAIRELPKPVVSAINGVAAGAGASLAVAADLVVAAEEASLVPAFGRIGLVPDSGLARTLVRGLGRHRASQILFGGEPLSASGAREAGLVAAVVPGAQLTRGARALAERLAAGPTRALGLTKRLVNAAEDATLDDALAQEAALQELAGRTSDHEEGVAAFREKREPRFTGH